MPAELGGGGADIDELAAMLRTLGYHCGSTALAFSMHSHQVAIAAWRWRHQKAMAVEPLLRRIAREHILIVDRRSDWIAGSGRAEKVEGGYRITARKRFVSGAARRRPADDRRHPRRRGRSGGPAFRRPDERAEGQDARHLAHARHARHRFTRVPIEGQSLPEASVTARRKAGEWDPLFHTIATMAFPLVYAVYLGVAESARDIAIALARQRQQPGDHAVELAGRMDTELTAARLASESMLLAVRRNAPSADTVNQVMIGRHLVARHAMAAVDLAMELAQGQASIVRPASSGGFATSRRRAITRCKPGRRPAMPAPWRSVFPSTGSSDDLPPHAGSPRRAGRSSSRPAMARQTFEAAGLSARCRAGRRVAAAPNRNGDSGRQHAGDLRLPVGASHKGGVSGYARFHSANRAALS